MMGYRTSGASASSSPMYGQLFKSGALVPLAQNAFVAIAFEQNPIAVGGVFWSPPSRLLIPQSGNWEIDGWVRFFNPDATGSVNVGNELHVQKNGNSYSLLTSLVTSQFNQLDILVQGILTLAAADYLELVAYNGVGTGPHSIGAAYFSAKKLS